jgi:hypothetical protein
MKTCIYKTELTAYSDKNKHIIGGYYPDVKAVVAWSTDAPPEMVMEFAGMVAEMAGVELDRYSSTHCDCGCPGATGIMSDHDMEHAEFDAVRQMFVDQVMHCIRCNPSLSKILKDMAAVTQQLHAA